VLEVALLCAYEPVRPSGSLDDVEHPARHAARATIANDTNNFSFMTFPFTMIPYIAKSNGTEYHTTSPMIVILSVPGLP